MMGSMQVAVLIFALATLSIRLSRTGDSYGILPGENIHLAIGILHIIMVKWNMKLEFDYFMTLRSIVEHCGI